MGSFFSSSYDSRNRCKDKRQAKRATTKLAIANSERAACMQKIAELQAELKDAEELEAMLVSLVADLSSKRKSCQQNRADVSKWRNIVHNTVEKLRSSIARKEKEAKMLR